MKQHLKKIFLIFGFSFFIQVSSALVFTDNTGTWPDSWPIELEPLRSSAKSFGIASANQEEVYEILFKDSDEFKTYWPSLLKLLSPGAPIKVTPMNDQKDFGLYTQETPLVRISTPKNNIAGNFQEYPDIQTMMEAEIQWPKSILNDLGELPEYICSDVIDGEKVWRVANVEEWKTQGFMFRCRTEIELVVDGDVISFRDIDIPTSITLVHSLDTRY